MRLWTIPSVIKKSWVTILCVAALLYCVLQPQFQTGVYNDDAIYVLAARFLWRGRMHWPSFADKVVFLFPGLPFLLAPIVKLIAPHWIMAEWTSVLAAMLSIVLLWNLMKPWLVPWQALIVLVLYAFNPTIVHFSGVLMPELYFLVAVLGSLLLLNQLLENPTRLKAWGLGLLLGWGSLIRPEGFLLLISFPLVLAVSKKWGEFIRVSICSVGIWLSYILHTWVGVQAGPMDYSADLAALVSYWPSHLGQIFHFSAEMLRVLWVQTVLAMQSNFLPGWANAAVWLGCLIVAGVGVIRMSQDRTVKPEMLGGVLLFCGLYFGIHVFWHIATERYCMVLIPFALIFLVRGIFAVAPFWGRRRMAVLAVASLLCLFYGYQNGFAMYESIWSPQPMNMPPWRSLEWLSRHTLPMDKVISPIAPNVTLYAERSAYSGINAINEEELRYLLMKESIEYIVDRPVSMLTTATDSSQDLNRVWNSIRQRVASQPRCYRVVHFNAVEKTTIYQVIQDPRYVAAYEIYQSALQDLEANHSDRGLLKLHACLNIDPDLSSAYNALGATYYLSGHQTEAAEANLQKAIRINPQYDVALLNLARLHYRLGQPAASKLYLKKALVASRLNDDSEYFQQILDASRQRGEIAPLEMGGR